MENKSTCVIFESLYTGHRSEYIRHLMKFINSQKDLHGEYMFILNEKMSELLGELCMSSNYFINFIDFDNIDPTKKHRNLITKSFWEWKLISGLISKQMTIQEIIFMNIDPYLVLVASPQFKKFNLAVKGILFQPYIHFKEIDGGITFFIKNVVKNYIFQKYSIFMNSNIIKIFILNDRKGVDLMNKQVKNVFFNLPDPIENDISSINVATTTKIKEKYAIKGDNKNLLVFGSIDDRKNIITIIDSLRLLPPEIKKNIHLIIAGKFYENVRESYIQHIEKYKNEISIIYNDAFVNAEEREPLFQSCDLVLMAYVNFFSASSVLGHSIIHNKNVLASNKGIIGRIVTENNIGITVDPTNPNEIKEAIGELLINHSNFEYNSEILVDEFSPINFSQKILLN